MLIVASITRLTFAVAPPQSTTPAAPTALVLEPFDYPEARGLTVVVGMPDADSAETNDWTLGYNGGFVQVDPVSGAPVGVVPESVMVDLEENGYLVTRVSVDAPANLINDLGRTYSASTFSGQIRGGHGLTIIAGHGALRAGAALVGIMPFGGCADVGPRVEECRRSLVSYARTIGTSDPLVAYTDIIGEVTSAGEPPDWVAIAAKDSLIADAAYGFHGAEHVGAPYLPGEPGSLVVLTACDGAGLAPAFANARYTLSYGGPLSRVIAEGDLLALFNGLAGRNGPGERRVLAARTGGMVMSGINADGDMVLAPTVRNVSVSLPDADGTCLGDVEVEFDAPVNMADPASLATLSPNVGTYSAAITSVSALNERTLLLGVAVDNFDSNGDRLCAVLPGSGTLRILGSEVNAVDSGVALDGNRVSPNGDPVEISLFCRCPP